MNRPGATARESLGEHVIFTAKFFHFFYAFFAAKAPHPSCVRSDSLAEWLVHVEEPEMNRFGTVALATALALLGACQQSCPPAPMPVAATAGALPAFVGSVWVSTTPGKARGSILIFLPDKTMLIDSCFEGFRVAEWGVISDNRIRWREDMVPIEAEYSQMSPDVLQLKPVGTSEPNSYVRAAVPYVCPDMPK